VFPGSLKGLLKSTLLRSAHINPEGMSRRSREQGHNKPAKAALPDRPIRPSMAPSICP
jgi:hypothetical protein